MSDSTPIAPTIADIARAFPVVPGQPHPFADKDFLRLLIAPRGENRHGRRARIAQLEKRLQRHREALQAYARRQA